MKKPSLPLFSNLRKIIRFLLFLEDEPKHRVVETIPLFWIWLIIVLPWIFSAYVTFNILNLYGLIPAVLSVLLLDLGYLETLHILLDW